ncbi:MAG: hypothetical protein PHR35_00535 [Kiritimatiellae bacterium]|nr:hypothetical protein [Kiritimatiellia bacterium]
MSNRSEVDNELDQRNNDFSNAGGLRLNHDRHSRRRRDVAVLMVAFALSGAATAGTVSVGNIPATGSDAASGLTSFKTYTHALDFGDATGTLNINGVTFTRVNAASGTGYSFTGPGSFNAHAGSSTTYTDGNVSNMLTGMFFNNTPSTTTPAVLTLTGLTPGKPYSTRIYYRRWDANPRVSTFTFNGDGADATIDVDECADAAAHYLAYKFTASGSEVTISAVAHVPNYVWLFFGVTTEEALDIPPATVAIVDLPPVDSDSSAGLSPVKSYTHALDFGDATGTLNINGVTFTRVNAASGTGYSFTGPGTFNAHPGNSTTYTDGNVSNMLTGMFFNNTSSTTTPAVLALTGLTPGKRYSTRIYYRRWDTAERTSTFTFNGDGSNTVIAVNQSADAGAHFLEYRFTATGNAVTISVVAQASTLVWHFCGVTTEEIYAGQPAALSIVDIPAVNADVSVGLNPHKVYAHALDFGDTTGTLLINGVTFTKVNSPSGTGYRYYTSSGTATFYTNGGNGNTHADGNISAMLNNIMYYNHGPSTLLLRGLTPDTKYSTRLYYRPWTDDGTRDGTISFFDGDSGCTVTLNADAGATAHYLQYDFTAFNTSLAIKMSYVSGTPWTLFGVTTEQILPAGTVIVLR